MLDYREALQKELKDPSFKQAWDSYELEYQTLFFKNGLQTRAHAAEPVNTVRVDDFI